MPTLELAFFIYICFMKQAIIVFLVLLCSNFLLGQFVYEADDFVEIGDELIYSTALNIDPSNDFTLSGEAVTWDFSNLTSINLDTAIYFDPNDAGYRFSYCFTNSYIFNCQSNFDELTNLAKLSVDSFAVGDFKTANITRHYHLSAEEFAETMLGVTAELQGIDVPVAIDFEERDVVLKFPLEYGNVDSSASRFVLDLTPVGYNAGFTRNRKRVNTVEGYGTLLTPAATYDEVLKVKTLIYNTDTTRLEAGSIPLTTTEIEYKWYAKGLPGHVMKASGTVILGNELITQVEFSGVEPVVSNIDLEWSDIEVFPNPFSEILQGRSRDRVFTSYELLNQLGQRVSHDTVNARSFNISLKLNAGTYYLILVDEEGARWLRQVVRI